MKYVLSRYNHDLSWIDEYTDDYILYDRSESPLAGAIRVRNVGSDIFDKLSFIIDHYDKLPDVAVYAKANLFKYISKEEFSLVKDNKTFTPLLTQHHKTYMPICYYKDGLYHELNNRWYLASHPAIRADELMTLLGLTYRTYLAFAPGSNYILPKENILQYPKEFYIRLRSFLEWDVYPGEAQIMERGLYYLWR